MFRTRTSLSALLVTLGVAPALFALADGLEYGPPSVPKRLSARIRLPEGEWDWGEVLQGEIVQHTFQVLNDGAGTLRINKVKASCGCTTVDWTRSIEPGESGEVTLEMNTEKIRAPHVKKNATISCNDPNRPTVKIHMGGKLLQLIAHDPKNVVLGGLVGESFQSTVTLKPGTATPIVVQEVTPRSRHIEVLNVREIEKGQHYEVDVKAIPSKRPSKLRDSLEVQVVDGEGTVRKTSIPVTVDHRDKIQIRPQGNVVFQRKETEQLRLPSGQPIQKEVLITSGADDITFRVTDVRLQEVPDGVFETELITVEEGTSYKVLLTLMQYVDDVRFVRGKLIVVTDDAGVPERELRIFAQFGANNSPRKLTTPKTGGSGKAQKKQ